MLSIPSKCLICGNETYVESVKCPHCSTVVTNKFAISKFDKLTESQAEFVLTFIGVEGNIREMEKALGISYPTVKSRLNEIRQVLGLNIKEQTSKKMEILEQIERGQLSVEAALKLIEQEDQND